MFGYSLMITSAMIQLERRRWAALRNDIQMHWGVKPKRTNITLGPCLIPFTLLVGEKTIQTYLKQIGNDTNLPRLK